MKIPGHAMTAQAGAVAALLPCPFDCGAKEAPIVGNDGFGGWTVYCAHCSACTHEMCDQAGAIAMWNRRPAAVPVEALEGLVAELRNEAATIAKPYGFVTEHILGKAEGLESCVERIERLIKERSNG